MYINSILRITREVVVLFVGLRARLAVSVPAQEHHLDQIDERCFECQVKYKSGGKRLDQNRTKVLELECDKYYFS